MSSTPPTRRHPWSWALAGLLLGTSAVLAVQHLGRNAVESSPRAADTTATAAPAASPSPAAADAVSERFVAPLDRQADTGALAIAAAGLPFRRDTFRIELPSGDEAGHELEQKLHLLAGGALVYQWSVSGIDNPEEFYADLHGHAPPGPDFREASFRRGGGLADSGSFLAPFEGIHGWLFKNDSASPAVVTLEVAGFYRPVSAGELARIEAQIENLAAP